MIITVSDPVKHSEGMNAYVTYKVTTKTDLPRFDHSHFYVHRRYSDFCWLQEQLMQLFPGLVVPPLPEKQVMRRFNEPFLSQRQRSLEKFLARIAAHEQLRDNGVVKAFLELESLDGVRDALAKRAGSAAGGEPSSAGSAPGAGSSNAQGGGSTLANSLWQWASAATSTLQSKMAGPPPAQRAKTEDDVRFDEIRAYVTSLEPQMVAVHKHVHGLVDKGKDMAQALFDFGLAFTLLGQAESDGLGEAMAQLGQCADKLSRITAVEADKERQFFDEPIRDYVRLVRQVKLALDVRTAKMAAYEQALAELDAKKAERERVARAAGGQAPGGAARSAAGGSHLDPGSHQSRVAAVEEELKAAQAASEAARAEFELVTSRVFHEVERFKRDKLADLKGIVLDYVQLQIEYNQQVEQSWRDVLPALQALGVQDAAPAVAAAAAPPTSPPTVPAADQHAATTADEEEAFV